MTEIGHISPLCFPKFQFTLKFLEEGQNLCYCVYNIKIKLSFCKISQTPSIQTNDIEGIENELLHEKRKNASSNVNNKTNSEPLEDYSDGKLRSAEVVNHITAALPHITTM